MFKCDMPHEKGEFQEKNVVSPIEKRSISFTTRECDGVITLFYPISAL